MKILYITACPPSTGFFELEYLTKELVKRGHSVTVFCPNVNRYNKDRKLFENTTVITEDGVEIHYFDVTFNFFSLLITPDLVTALRNRIKNFDIVQLYGFRDFQDLFGYYYAKRNNIPYILTPQGSTPYHKTKNLRKVIFDALVGKRMLKNTSKVVAFNELEKEEILKMGCDEEKASIIPVGININKFETLPLKGSFRKKYNINEQILILFLGRIHYIKGLDYLVEAFAEITRKYPSVRLAIAGEDHGYLTELKRLITRKKLEDKITFMGYIFGTAKMEVLVDADFLILPSRYDIFPNVILEALICETPVITTINCGLAKIVEKEKLGKVTSLNHEELIAAIQEMIFDDSFRKSAGKRGRKFISENFNIEKVSKMYEALYYSCLKRD